jgi:hypothetical protein
MRELLVFLSVTVFGTVLILLAFAVSLNHVFGTPEYIKRSLAESDLYNRVVNDVLDQSQSAADEAGEGTLPLEREEVRKAANEAFGPELLQRSAETAIDGTYVWLEGEEPKPDFRIDLQPAKTDFANRIGSYVRERLAGLPPCSLSNMPRTTDPFTINCRPPGVNFEPEIRRLTNQLATSSDYLPDTVITPEDIKVKQNGQDVPFYQAADDLPNTYGWLARAPLILGLLAILLAAAVIAISRGRGQGTKRVGVTLIISGIVVLISFGLFGLVVSALGRRVGEANVHAADYVQNNIATALLASLQQALRSPLITFGALYIVVGLLLFLTLRRFGRR